MTAWETFFSAFGGTATALLAVGALFTFIIQHRLNLRLASFNAKLQAELAKMTAELTVVAKRQEIAFGTLHVKRAQIIAELYSRLADLHYEMLNLMDNSRSHIGDAEREAERREPKTRKIYLLWYETEEYYRKHSIYFVEPLHGQLYILIHKLQEAPQNFIAGADHPREAKDAMYRLLDEVNGLLKSVKGEFQTLLEVSEITPTLREQPPIG